MPTFGTARRWDYFDTSWTGIGYTQPVWTGTATPTNAGSLCNLPNLSGFYIDYDQVVSDTELFVHMYDAGSGTGGWYLLICVTNPGASLNGYALKLSTTTADFTLVRLDAGVETTLTGTYNTYPIDIRVGIKKVGNDLYGWIDVAGVPTQILTANDSTYNVGYLGVQNRTATTIQFGGMHAAGPTRSVKNVSYIRFPKNKLKKS